MKQKRNPENFIRRAHPLERQRSIPKWHRRRDEFNARAAQKVFENSKRRKENWK